MKTYILKLKTTSTTNYNLYDGTTLVSDSDLATLFGSAGSAYFTFDFNEGTPTNTTSLTILNSQDTAVMTNTGLEGIAEDRNFKGVWTDSATAFTSFTLLKGVAMDEAELTTLVGMVKNAGGIKTLTTADYNYHYSGSTDDGVALWRLPQGIYIKPVGVKAYAGSGNSFIYFGDSEATAIITPNTGYSQLSKSMNVAVFGILVGGITGCPGLASFIVRVSNGAVQSPSNFDWSQRRQFPITPNMLSSSVSNNDNYTAASSGAVYTLNENKADKTAFTGTDGTAAGTMGLVPAPATTDAGKFLKADGTWDDAGSSVNVVQTTGTSTTDVMSQDAATKMVYTSSGTGIRIGYGTAGTNHGIAIGYSTNTNGANNGIAIGEAAEARSYNVALGSAAKAYGDNKMGVSIGRLAGENMSSTIKGYVNLGSHSKATHTGEVNIGTSDTTEGYNSSNYRLISGLYDGQSAHDAATYGQLNTRLGGLTLVSISQTDYDNLQTYDPNTLYVITGA